MQFATGAYARFRFNCKQRLPDWLLQGIHSTFDQRAELRVSEQRGAEERRQFTLSHTDIMVDYCARGLRHVLGKARVVAQLRFTQHTPKNG